MASCVALPALTAINCPEALVKGSIGKNLNSSSLSFSAAVVSRNAVGGLVCRKSPEGHGRKGIFRVSADLGGKTSTVTPAVPLPPGKRFIPRSDKVGAIVGAAAAPAFRLGLGLFVMGYTVGLQKADKAKYAVLSALGFQINEGSSVIASLPRPAQPLQIFEFEGCPFCRKVREMVAVLDIDVLYYPCPSKSPVNRPKAISLGGKKQFPYLIDPNTGISMYESDDIIKYLANTYGNGSIPLLLKLGILTTLTAALAMIFRGSKGSVYVPAKPAPSEPLEIWAYESSPFCKIVREALCELELPFIVHSVARGSPKRQAFFEEHGGFQVPYLEDPNTNAKMFESADIIDYLYATYALPPTPTATA
eukprot:TRINITY_DN3215_c0_g1_i1.p1 TRINITY_DN3215_c0_g1~~TRINITY_DN3215_c0_g1_i1.p1  ORF type:complete len:389 (+),score=58.28 TRINITY_DN3215_c0_g1_i1:79-1167(+)